MKKKSTTLSRWFASLTLLALLLGAALSARATAYTWNAAAGGSWLLTSSSGWNAAAYPNGASDTANFSQNFTAAPTFTLDNGATGIAVNKISYQDTTATLYNGTISLGTGTAGLTFAGTTPTLDMPNATPQILFISAPVTIGSAGLTKTGPGLVLFSGAITASGSPTLTINGGGLNDGSGLLTGVGGLTVASGCYFQISYGTAGTYANIPATITGTGDGQGAIDFRISPSVAVAATWPGTITLGTGGAQIGMYGVTPTVTLGKITGSGPLTLDGSGGSATVHVGIYQLNQACDYTGDTSFLLNGGLKVFKVRLGINNALPTGTVLTLKQKDNTSSGGIQLDLNGKSQQLAGLTKDANNTSTKYLVYNSIAGTASTLTIANNAPYTFDGVIGFTGLANINLIKQGSDIFTLKGANIYTGTTTLTSGKINLGVAEVAGTSGPLGKSAAANAGSIVLNGGTLQYSAANQNDYSGRFSTAANQAYNIDVNSQTVAFGTALTSSGGTLTLNDSGSGGKLTLGAGNTYSGTTTINSGTLALGASGSLNSGSSVNIAAGATFDVSAIGAYTWGGSASLTANGSSSAAAILKGGTTVDMTGRSLTLNFTPAGISGDSAHPALNVSAGTLNLASTTIAVNNNYSSALDVGDYTLISGTVTGTPTTTTVTVGGSGLVAGASATLDASSGQLVMHVTSSATVTTTTLTRTAGVSPATYGDSLTFHAVLSPDPGNGTVITFKTNGVAFGTATTTSGVANLTLNTLPYSGGSAWTVTANFAGTPSFAASSGTLTGGQQVNQYALTLTGATAQSKIFDGTTAATITGGTLSGTVNGDVIGTNAAFASATVGNGIAVTVALTGTAAANYSLTLVSPSSLAANIFANPTWANPAGGVWDTAGNWVSSTIGTGSGVTADFSQLDITADTTVSLNSARTIGNLIFGDTNTATAAGWTLDNNSTPANILTLAGGTPTITVNSLGGTATATISAVVAGTTLTKAGTGTLVLSGANTYSSGTTISGSQAAANPLRLANSQAAGAGAIAIGSGGNTDQARLELTGGITVTNSFSAWPSRNTPSGSAYAAPSILNVSGVNQINSSISGGSGGGQSTLQSDAGSLVLLGTIATRQLNLIGAGDGELRGVVALSGNNLFKDGTGTWTLLGTNTYTGNTTISNGTLTIGGAGQLGSGAYAGNITNNAAFNYASTAAQTLSGIILGIGSLTNSGNGTLTLSGPNTYTGNTTISSGTLALSGGGSISSSAQISIATNATFDLSGVTSGYSFSTALAVNINQTGATLTQGQVAIGGKALTYGGTLTVVSNANSDAFASGDSFTLFVTNGTANQLSGWFSSVTLPALNSGLAWDTNDLATAGLLDVYTFTTTPVAFWTPTNTAATIAAAKLANHVSSAKLPAAYPALGWSATATPPANGGSVMVNADGSLTYTPAGAANVSGGTDSFTVTFYDGNSSQTMAVTVTVGTSSSGGQSPNVVNSGIDGSGKFYALFAGLPNTPYTVETNSLVTGGTWVKYADYTTVGDGLINVTNVPPVSGSLYFRTVYPSY